MIFSELTFFLPLSGISRHYSDDGLEVVLVVGSYGISCVRRTAYITALSSCGSHLGLFPKVV